MLSIPFISAILYLTGGQWWKPARWLMGVPIAIVGTCTHHYWAIMAIPTYWIATSVFPYGEHSWLNFLTEGGKFAVCGLALGLASFVVLTPLFAIIQGIVGAVSFVILKVLDDMDKVKNPWQELLRGGLGTCLLLFA